MAMRWEAQVCRRSWKRRPGARASGSKLMLSWRVGPAGDLGGLAISEINVIHGIDICNKSV